MGEETRCQERGKGWQKMEVGIYPGPEPYISHFNLNCRHSLR